MSDLRMIDVEFEMAIDGQDYSVQAKFDFWLDPGREPEAEEVEINVWRCDQTTSDVYPVKIGEFTAENRERIRRESAHHAFNQFERENSK